MTRNQLWKLFAVDYRKTWGFEPEKGLSEDEEMYKWWKKGYEARGLVDSKPVSQFGPNILFENERWWCRIHEWETKNKMYAIGHYRMHTERGLDNN